MTHRRIGCCWCTSRDTTTPGRNRQQVSHVIDKRWRIRGNVAGCKRDNVESETEGLRTSTSTWPPRLREKTARARVRFNRGSICDERLRTAAIARALSRVPQPEQYQSRGHSRGDRCAGGSVHRQPPSAAPIVAERATVAGGAAAASNVIGGPPTWRRIHSRFEQRPSPSHRFLRDRPGEPASPRSFGARRYVQQISRFVELSLRPLLVHVSIVIHDLVTFREIVT